MQAAFRRYFLAPFVLAGLAASSCGRAPADVEASASTTTERKLAVQPWLPLPELSDQEVVSGKLLEVRCPSALETDGSAPPPLQPQIDPPLRRVRSDAWGHAYVAGLVGTYSVRCLSADGQATGRAVQVRVSAGAPVAVALVLQPNEVAAGEPAIARCVGLDDAGNEVQPPGSEARVVGSQAAPPAALATGGTLTAARFESSAPLQMRAQDGRTLELRSTKLGPVTLRCNVPAWPALPSSPAATLQVKAAAPTQLFAEASAETHRSGAFVPVRCTARDAHGNEVSVAGEVVANGPGPVRTVPGGLHATVAGTYAVRCRLAGNDDAPALTSAEVAVQVVAGPAAKWRVNLYRQGRCFSHRQRLPLTWTAWDDANNRVDNVQVTLETVPPTQVDRDASGGFVFTEEGSYDVIVRPLGEAAERLKPWPDHVVIDSTPPRLELLSPARGAMLQSPNGRQMLVGRVSDPVSALASLVINGVPQPIVPGAHEQHFEVPFDSAWGLSVVRGTAEDACGNIATLRQSFLRSESFGPATDVADPAARVAHAARAAVAQPLWDDGDPTGGHDISNLLQRAMAGGGLDERLPDHLAAFTLFGKSKTQLDTVHHRCVGWETDHKEDGIEVMRTGKLRMGEPAIEFLHVEEGGAHLAVRFADLNLPLSVSVYAGLPCGPAVHPTARATLHADALRIEVRARVSMQDGRVKVDLCPNCAHAEFPGRPPELRFDDPDHPGNPGPLLNARFANWALQATSNRLRAALENRVREDVVGEAERLLTGLHIDHALPLPAPLVSQANVLSGVDGITLRGGARGGGTSEVSLYTQVTTPLLDPSERANAPVPLPPLRGPIRQDTGDLVRLELADSETFAVAVRDDMLNQMLWSLWAGGVFNGVDPRTSAKVEAKQEGGLLDASSWKLYFTSPPVVMPSHRAGEVRIGVGDVYAEVELDTYSLFGSTAPVGRHRLAAKFYFSMSMRAKLGVDSVRRTLRVDPVGLATVDIQVTHIERPAMYDTVNTWLGNKIKKMMPSILTQPLVAFPLTKLQIGRLPGIPKDAVWTLEEAEIERPAEAQEFIMRGRLSTLPEALSEAGAGARREE